MVASGERLVKLYIAIDIGDYIQEHMSNMKDYMSNVKEHTTCIEEHMSNIKNGKKNIPNIEAIVRIRFVILAE